MPALRVAVDLTALEWRVDRPWAGSLPVRFAEALIHEAPAVTFTVLTRPATRAALAHLEAANARQFLISEPSQLRSVVARFQARLRQRFSRFRDRRDRNPLSLWERVGVRAVWLNSLQPLLSHRHPGVLAKLRVNVVFCPFTSSGFSDLSVPLVIAVDDLRHVSHPHLLTSGERTARAQAFSDTSHRAARIVCSTPSLRDVAVQSDGTLAERVISVSPGRLLTQPSARQPATAATLARHGLEANRFFLLVADFEPRHNHRLVLTALAMFRARFPDSEIRLVCVGGPAPALASFKLVADQMGLGPYVQFVGVLGREETSALMEGCRAVLVPGLYETVGETVVEAMHRGRPVLCSQIPGLAELTGGAALTFDPHRPADLAAAFERVERAPALLARLAQLGRERVATMDDAHAVAEAYLGVFRDVMTTCPRSR
jgi:glycosyltransferase involved in cell wall biosynthesis